MPTELRSSQSCRHTVGVIEGSDVGAHRIGEHCSAPPLRSATCCSHTILPLVTSEHRSTTSIAKSPQASSLGRRPAGRGRRGGRGRTARAGSRTAGREDNRGRRCRATCGAARAAGPRRSPSDRRHARRVHPGRHGTTRRRGSLGARRAGDEKQLDASPRGSADLRRSRTSSRARRRFTTGRRSMWVAVP